MKSKKYLTDTEVAEMTGLAVQTLRNWRQARKNIPFIKLKRSVRYDAEAVADFMSKHTVPVDQGL